MGAYLDQPGGVYSLSLRVQTGLELRQVWLRLDAVAAVEGYRVRLVASHCGGVLARGHGRRDRAVYPLGCPPLNIYVDIVVLQFTITRMTHRRVVEECEKNGLTVKQVQSQYCRAYDAVRSDGLRVYWSTSYEGGMLGKPRIVCKGRDTHADQLSSIAYYARLKE